MKSGRDGTDNSHEKVEVDTEEGGEVREGKEGRDGRGRQVGAEGEEEAVRNCANAYNIGSRSTF